MRLIRNTSKDGSCKYGLVNLPALAERLKSAGAGDRKEIAESVEKLKRHGVLELGTEAGTGEKGSRQFFVVRYSDKLTAPALRAYADAARKAAEALSAEGHGDEAKELDEYAAEVDAEAEKAEAAGNHVAGTGK